MRRRNRGESEILFSLDSLLDIVANVVGVLVLLAVVTVLAAGDASVPVAKTVERKVTGGASRMLFECSGNEIHFVDEDGNGGRVQRTVKEKLAEEPKQREDVATLLDRVDVGDETHRVRAEALPEGLTWIYELRPMARGDTVRDLERGSTAFGRALARADKGAFAYFVVHDDSFEVFRKARDIARARGFSIGWHPVEGRGPLRIATTGSLGRRIQ